MENMQKINSKDLHYLEASHMHPANTYFHFSFANYYDPQNMNFGALRVVNDDDVKPKGGFGTHPHRDMEIFSYIVHGQLTHRDSAGNHEVLSRGHVQAISAGTGVTHSELNEQNDWCRFLQIWILPEALDLPVSYSLHKYDFEERKNKLLQIISGTKSERKAPLSVNQDLNAYVSELTEKDKKVHFKLQKDRQAYILCIEGSIKVDEDTVLDERDSLKVLGESDLEFSLKSEAAHFMIIEMELEK